MQAVILAAGAGNRLGDMTKDKPKALVRVAGRELILWVADFIDHTAIEDRIVVTGFEADRLERFIEQSLPGMRTVRNPNFMDGSVRTIEAALPHLETEFLILNADHIYQKRLFAHILRCRDGITAVCDFDRPLGDDDMKIKRDAEGHLKNIRKTLEEYDGGYIGMTYCSAGMLSKYREGVAATRKTLGDLAPIEFVLGTLAPRIGINICDASGTQWLEIDTPDDLARADRTLRNEPDFLL